MAFICIYCEKEKPDEEMTLEHVVPQFLGGAYLPDQYKTRRVCGKCNNNLGLFVDAAFEKNWVIANWLKQSARSAFTPENPISIPLTCMGQTDYTPPGMTAEETCELYFGPFGEIVYWVRPTDERLWSYTGGNPRTTKKMPSRAYFFSSPKTNSNPLVTWLSFEKAFEGRNVKKVFAFNRMDIATDPAEIGFSAPDDLDKQRIGYLSPITFSGKAQIKFSLDIDYEVRFLAKLARGIGFCLIGDDALKGDYARAITKALWSRKEEEISGIQGMPALALMEKDKELSQRIGMPNAITLLITNMPAGIGINLTIGTNQTSSLLCMEPAILSEEIRRDLGYGRVLVMFPHFKKAYVLSMLDYMQHKTSSVKHREIAALEAAIADSKNYFDQFNDKPISQTE